MSNPATLKDCDWLEQPCLEPSHCAKNGSVCGRPPAVDMDCARSVADDLPKLTSDAPNEF